MYVSGPFATDRDDVHVEVGRVTKDVLHHATEWAKRRTRTTRAEHDLGTSLGASESDKGSGGVVVDNFLKLSLKLDNQFAGQGGIGLAAVNAVGALHVDGDDLSAGSRRDPRGPTQEDLVDLASRHADNESCL